MLLECLAAFVGLKSWKFLLACSTIPLGIMLAWSSRWWGWWWQLCCIEDMSATTASRFDRQQALLLEVHASYVCVQSPEICLSQTETLATSHWLSGHRGAWAIWYPSGRMGGGNFGLHNCLFCRLPLVKQVGFSVALSPSLVCIIHEPWSKCSKNNFGRSGRKWFITCTSAVER